jgi:hypothetical protein
MREMYFHAPKRKGDKLGVSRIGVEPVYLDEALSGSLGRAIASTSTFWFSMARTWRQPTSIHP